MREGDQRALDEEVRSQDLEPYVTLRYIALLFKVLSVLIFIALLIEITIGLMTEGASSLPELIGQITKLLVFAGLMWAAGDITLLLIDAGHDLRVARILLGRINHEMHRANSERSGKLAAASSERRADPTRT